jgi:hypothetical protein
MRTAFADTDNAAVPICGIRGRQACRGACEAALQQFEQRQQQQVNQRADESLAAAAQGPRAWEFHTAYSKLTSLDPKVRENQTLARRILKWVRRSACCVAEDRAFAVVH